MTFLARARANDAWGFSSLTKPGEMAGKPGMATDDAAWGRQLRRCLVDLELCQFSDGLEELLAAKARLWTANDFFQLPGREKIELWNGQPIGPKAMERRLSPFRRSMAELRVIQYLSAHVPPRRRRSRARRWRRPARLPGGGRGVVREGAGGGTSHGHDQADDGRGA